MLDQKYGRYKVNFITVAEMVALLAFSLLVLPLRDAFIKDFELGFQFMLIGIITVVALCIENQRYSFSASMNLYFFSYLFFFCAPLFQLSNDTFRWFLYPSIDEMIFANTLILSGLASFFIGNLFSVDINIKERIKHNKNNFEVRNKILYLFIVLLSIYILYLFTFLSISDFFSRATFQTNTSSSQAIGLIITSVRNGIALICLLVLIKKFKEKKSFFNAILLSYFIGVTLFLVPPTGVARFLSGAFYGTVLLYSFPRLRSGRLFLVLMFLFILIIFPMLNNFRYINSNPLQLFDILSGLSDNFQSADFDAYTMLLYITEYVTSFGITFGYQLLGPILFFIPRSIWADKPVGSGSMIVDELGIPINGNVSAPWIGEFYINYGYFGVLIFSFIVGVLLRSLDKKYWDKNNSGYYFKLIYPFFSLMIIFICRGDFMSSYSFLFGTIISTYFTYHCLSKKE